MLAEEKRREILHIAKTQQALVQDEPKKEDELIQPAPTPELNPRNRAAAEIAARSNATRDAEAKETLPAGPEDAAMQEPEVPNVAGDAEPEPQARDEAGKFVAKVEPAPGFDTDAEYELLVEGRPVKVKGSQIIDRGRLAIQKETAADYKLELASSLLKDIEARTKTPVEVVPDKSFQEMAQDLQFGTTEQAAARIKEVVERAVTQATQAATKVVPGMTQDQLAFQKAVDLVNSEYEDLMADPYLKPLFFAEENKRRQAGDRSSYTDLYKAIGEDLRKHFNRPKAVTTPAQTLAQRQEAKAAAPAAPKLASVRLSGGETKKAPTREEIISGMRESRGMHSLTKH